MENLKTELQGENVVVVETEVKKEGFISKTKGFIKKNKVAIATTLGAAALGVVIGVAKSKNKDSDYEDEVLDMDYDEIQGRFVYDENYETEEEEA